MTAKPTYEELEQKVKELQQSEEKYRQKTERYRQLTENLNEVLYMLDLEAKVTYVSPNIERLSGHRPEEIVGRRFTDFVHTDDLEGRIDSFLKVVAGEGITTEYRYLTKAGETKWVMTNARPTFENNEIVGIQGMLVDITSRKEMEDELLKSRERYRNILENIEEGYYEIDMKGNLLFSNDALCGILGYSRSELFGRNVKDLVDRINAKKMYKTADWLQRTGKAYKALDWELVRKDGSACSIETSVSMVKDSEMPLKFRGVARDITERKKAEQEKENLRAQLRRAQQMEAIGTLAGGIAHDFNNILFAVIGYTEILLAETPKGSLFYNNLSRILEAGNRAKDLVRQILTVAREEREEYALVSVVPMVKEAMRLLRSTLPTSIELRENIDNNEQLIVKANPTQLHQIIVNLATNAKYAMSNKPGVLEVRVICLFDFIPVDMLGIKNNQLGGVE